MSPLVPGPVRAIAAVLACLGLLLSSVAGAHATLVIGTLSFTPAFPGGQPATTTLPGLLATLVLEDPGLVEVEDAVVFLELRTAVDGGDPLDANKQPSSEPVYVSDRFPETAPGTYQLTIPAPAPGDYVVSIRDRTYRQEEAVANLALTFTADGVVGEHPFVLPPTATGPASLGQWLLWVLGVPLAVGVVVTVLVLRGGRGQDEAEEPEHE